MNASDVIRDPQIRARLTMFRPGPPRKVESAIQVLPRSARYGLIGTAFDYLLRFELGRRSSRITEGRWIAELLLERETLSAVAANETVRAFLRSHAAFDRDGLNAETENQAIPRMQRYFVSASCGLKDPYDACLNRVIERVIAEARADVAIYRANPVPSVGEVKQAAFQAIRLAKLDVLYRVGRLDQTFETAERCDIDEVTELLRIVNWRDFPIEASLMLNPTLGCGDLEIGADADLIAGDCIVDIKTTGVDNVKGDWLDQLLVYLLLARHRRRRGDDIPEIQALGVYFARHGFLWKREVRTWTGHPQFPEFEQWFVQQFVKNRMIR